jgi:hypothetical protein
VATISWDGNVRLTAPRAASRSWRSAPMVRSSVRPSWVVSPSISAWASRYDMAWRTRTVARSRWASTSSPVSSRSMRHRQLGRSRPGQQAGRVFVDGHRVQRCPPVRGIEGDAAFERCGLEGVRRGARRRRRRRWRTRPGSRRRCVRRCRPGRGRGCRAGRWRSRSRSRRSIQVPGRLRRPAAGRGRVGRRSRLRGRRAASKASTMPSSARMASSPVEMTGSWRTAR